MIYDRIEGWVDRVLLVGAIVALVVGAVFAVAGNQQAADLLWAVITAAVGIRLVVTIAIDLFHRHAGVDIIAVLAVIGALLLGEYLAGAVIALMLTTGTALEAYAEGRAGRELSALLARAPRVAHRYEDGTLVTRSVDELTATLLETALRRRMPRGAYSLDGDYGPAMDDVGATGAARRFEHMVTGNERAARKDP